jgi:adenylate cyclase
MEETKEIQRVFLIADLSGYTALTEAHGGISAARIVKRYIEIMQECLHAVHIGIHAGSVLEQDGQFFGSAINIASRTAAHARAGQILCTEAAIELVVDKSAIRYQPLGKIQFKNIAEPISIFEIAAGHSALNMNVTDPVCRMQLKPDTAPDRLNYQGQNYFFCSFDCARTFASHPELYTK